MVKANQFTSTFATLVRNEMNKQGVDTLALTNKIIELSDRKVTYDHVRKAIKGDLAPSKFLIDNISKALGLNRDEMSAVVMKDRMRATLGNNAMLTVLKVKEGVDEINDLWEDLSPSHRDDILGLVRNWAKSDRASGHKRTARKHA
jgi:hypothetical protein